MTTFPESGLLKKLGEFNPSQESIQTLSLWLIHYRKHFETIVKIWYQELIKAPIERKILFMYLANDVIQTSRKKGPEYSNEFGSILPIAIRHVAGLDSLDAESRCSLERIVKIWGERGMYETGKIEEFKKALRFEVKEPVKNKRHPLKDGDKKKRAPRTPSRYPTEDDKIISILSVKDKRRSHEDEEKKKKKKRVDSPAECNKKTVKFEVKGHVEEKKDNQVKISRSLTSGDPPKDDEIISILPVNPKRRSRKDGDKTKSGLRAPSGDPPEHDEVISLLPGNDKRRSRKDGEKKKGVGSPAECNKKTVKSEIQAHVKETKDAQVKITRCPNSGDQPKDDEIICILPVNGKRRSSKDEDKTKRGPRAPSGDPPEDDEVISILLGNDKMRSHEDEDKKKGVGSPPAECNKKTIKAEIKVHVEEKLDTQVKISRCHTFSGPPEDDKIFRISPVNDNSRSRNYVDKKQRGPRTPPGDPPEDNEINSILLLPVNDEGRPHGDEDKKKGVGSPPAECNKKTAKPEIKPHVQEKKDTQVKVTRYHTSGGPPEDYKIFRISPVNDNSRYRNDGDKKQRGPRTPPGDPPEDDEIISKLLLPVNDEGRSHESEDQKKEKKQKGVDSPAECNEKTAKPEIKPHVQEKKDTQVKVTRYHTSGGPPEDYKIFRISPVNDNSRYRNDGDKKQRGPRTPPGDPPEDDEIISKLLLPVNDEGRSNESEDQKKEKKQKGVDSAAECNEKTAKPEIKPHVQEKKDTQVKVTRYHTSGGPPEDYKIFRISPVNDNSRSRNDGDKKQRGPRTPPGDPPEDDEIISKLLLPVNDEGRSHESEDQKKEKKKKGVDSAAECNEKTAKPEIKPHVQEKKDTQVKVTPCHTSSGPPEDYKIFRISPVNDNSRSRNDGDKKKRGPRTPPGDPPEDDFSILLMPDSPEEFNEEPEIKPHVQEKKDTQVKISTFYTYGIPPDDDEVIRALLDLENSPSADAALREAIANMPPEITEDSFLKTITDKNQAKQHLQSVSAASLLLTNYNERLDQELEDREKVMIMLQDYTIIQLSFLSEAKEHLEKYQGILQSARSVRDVVQSHLNNLPDIKQDVLAPLPTADDLFGLDI